MYTDGPIPGPSDTAMAGDPIGQLERANRRVIVAAEKPAILFVDGCARVEESDHHRDKSVEEALAEHLEHQDILLPSFRGRTVRVRFSTTPQERTIALAHDHR